MITILKNLHSQGLRVTADNDQILVTPKRLITDEIRHLIRAHKSELLQAVHEDPINLEPAEVCQNLSITSHEVRQALAPDEIDEWNRGDLSRDALAVITKSLIERRVMDQGLVPKYYSKHAICQQCGPVWLWFKGEVLGCPWCWNRIHGRPVPRPDTSNLHQRKD